MFMIKPNTTYGTPKEFYEFLNAMVGGFAVDAAANGSNTHLPTYYGPDSPLVGGTDALIIDQWASPAFCNPPYHSHKEWTRWLECFRRQGDLGVTVVTILPAAVGTRWWFDGVIKAQCDIVFLTGRLPFIRPDGEPTKPNHDSAVVIYGPGTISRYQWIDWATRIKIEKVKYGTNSEVAGQNVALDHPVLGAGLHIGGVSDDG